MLHNVITHSLYVGWLAVAVGSITFRDVQSEMLGRCSMNAF